MSGSMDELDNRRMSLRWLSDSRERRRNFVLNFGEELFATVCAAKHGYNALNMRNVFRKIPRRECDVAEEGQRRRVVDLRIQLIIAV